VLCPYTSSNNLQPNSYRYSLLGEDAEGVDGLGNLDGDTTISRYTFDAALHAAGSVCHAVDLIMAKHKNSGSSFGEANSLPSPITNAFCAVRPPGHHAGPKGLVKGIDGGPDSHGFCLMVCHVFFWGG
jgi:acetoin utilization deacetylase AcuC-like enzyme